MNDRLERNVRTMKNSPVRSRLAAAFLLLAVVSGTAAVALDPVAVRQELSPYMNSIPPSNNFFAVGTGAANRVRHPDRAPHTQLAQHDGVILFSGAAPQLGLNFSLSAGSLVYRNQMSSLGAPEPPPQVGTAGTLLEGRTKEFLPWSEARWHQGEDIAWYGYRTAARWIDGIPYWEFQGNGSGNPVVCTQDDLTLADPSHTVHHPNVTLDTMEGDLDYGLNTSANLQLSRGLFQASRIRASLRSDVFDGCSSEFREPWLQARGLNPAFDTAVDGYTSVGSNKRIAKDYYPNYLNIYPYRTLELDGGRLNVNFERSATWPRQPTTYNSANGAEGGATSGAVVAESVTDEYGNVVVFDRVPKYGWETDYKVPPMGGLHNNNDAAFASLPELYLPTPNAWRMPHKKLRTVQLFSADTAAAGGPPEWTIAFVYEHPDSDRISEDEVGTDASKWKSLYSHLPQSDWEFGRLPELNDETTLLTVQAYKSDVNQVDINGAKFQDDYYVWGNTVGAGDASTNGRLNSGQNSYNGTRYADRDRPGDNTTFLGEGCPGRCGEDDDGDGLVDEDTNGYQAYLNVSSTNCTFCQSCVKNYPTYDSMPSGCKYGGVPGCFDINEVPLQTWDATVSDCKNPLYWRPGLTLKMDPLAYMDDDEDGLIDEDGENNPLLVNIRAIDSSTGEGSCASGRYPFVPPAAGNPEDAEGLTLAVLPITPDDEVIERNCRDGSEDGLDPWTHQVQYVYARTNPYWLLFGRTSTSSINFGSDPPGVAPGEVIKPKYYYFAPFSADIDNEGDPNGNDLIYDANGDGYVPGQGDVREIDLCGGDGATFPCTITDSLFDEPEAQGQPNVHPDCLPDPEFLGPQAKDPSFHETPFPPVGPSDVHLIKRVVRSRPDVENDPRNMIESTWLYRYNDIGFLKAVFDPQSIQQIIDADDSDAIDDPDDILRYADTQEVGGLPLIHYAAQWYTYYNPVTMPGVGIEQCYEEPPFIGLAEDLATFGVPDDVLGFLPMNACDGQRIWGTGLENEIHTDPVCSPFFMDSCGWCYAYFGCPQEFYAYEPDPPATCGCPEGLVSDPVALRQMGIEGAQPRNRKYKVKTARVRGADGASHLYRFDYLGAANSVYTESARITSYADAHNITIVDEMVEQTSDELSSASNRSDFYIYENDFALSLDGGPNYNRSYWKAPLYRTTSHYLGVPSKVKTRRVVIMNYYGIAISDRLMLTPGYDGDTTSIVDNQRYELTNERGQVKHNYDESWVAQFRDGGVNATKVIGRVFTELFGGQEGWHSVLRGIARGAAGGNLYNQQCKTPEVLTEVPVQRVEPAQLVLLGLTEHDVRTPDGSTEVRDMPKAEVQYYSPKVASTMNISDTTGCGCDPADPACTLLCDVFDPAGTIGTSTCLTDPGTTDQLDNIDLHNQGAVIVNPGYTDQFAAEGDGAALVRYHYKFHDLTNQSHLQWKYRWQEAVNTAQGGTGDVALEVWYFDTNGNIRLYGKGAGNDATPPAPTAPFYVTYYGFDGLGRQNIQIEDFDCTLLQTLDLTLFNAISGSGFGRQALGAPHPDSAARNFTTLSKYNDIGVLESILVGTPFPSAFSGPPEDWVADDWDDLHRTDYKIIDNRLIRRQETISVPPYTIHPVAWEDPFTYQIQYDDVSADGTRVFGKTTVTVYDKGGRFLERRVIAWNPARATYDPPEPYPDPDPDVDVVASMTDKIESFGWGLTLQDYSYDNAIQELGSNVPDKYWSICNDPADCYAEVNLTHLNFDPPPLINDSGAWIWPPPEGEQIVTLSRDFKAYEQKSSLKPTHDITYNSYLVAPEPNKDDDPQIVMRQYLYDLEDRIARQKDPDGTITRLLFDSKRRPIKTFKGSSDDCSDWFPRTPTGTPDDMVLVEQRLYNDGEPDCEANHNYDDQCEVVGVNEDFPNDAGKLVRTRRFTDDAEPCDGFYNVNTRSRDTQYVYDWRGRPVITKEVSVNTDNPAAAPKVISATVTVYDNLDRPIVVATYVPPDVTSSVTPPLLDTIEGWENIGTTANGYKPWAELVVAQLLSDTDSSPRGSVSVTLYDERGRVYEQRSYDPGITSATAFTTTRTYRDDLDRVTKEVSPNGVVTNTYDAQGRVVQTSLWTEDNTGSHTLAAGLELTRIVRTYSSRGQVQTETHYDRKPGTSGDLDDVTGDGNAVITYTYNWYEPATDRLIATASFGTGVDDGYTTNDQGPHGTGGGAIPYDDEASPTWTPTSSPNGGDYMTGTNKLDDYALVTRYGYDLLGRRVWVQDPKGIVTRTWYDLLGRTLLVAENWKDFDGNSGPADASGAPTDLTPGHSGPIRYTAHHYTRGGLLDMMVAIIPSDEVAQLKPDDIAWVEGDAATDFAATGVTVANATVQATSFVYGADLVNESDHASVISKATNLVSRIEYPDPDNAGQPNSADALEFKFTVGGHVAQRKDQRQVTLDYHYDTTLSCGSCSSAPGNQPTEIRVDYPTTTDPDAPAETVDHLSFGYDPQGRLEAAQVYGPDAQGTVQLLSTVSYDYDTMGNLEQETLDPAGDGNSGQAKSVNYGWAWHTPAGGSQRNRLESITYPTMPVPFKYTYDTGSWNEKIGRMTGLKIDGTPGTPIIHYATTGGGRNITQTWGGGGGKVQLDYNFKSDNADASLFDRFGRIKTMDLKKMSDDTTIHKYTYVHDANGNRVRADVQQQAPGGGLTNNRDYLYGYDRLNRLIHAERGTLFLDSDISQWKIANSGKGRAWDLDLLGNWSGSPSDNRSVVDYTIWHANDDDQLPGFDAKDTLKALTHHAADATNAITTHTHDDDVQDANPPVDKQFYHDAAGNLVFDGEKFFKYDAWNRVAAVYNNDHATNPLSVSNGILAGEPGTVVAQYAYDALGRRIAKTLGTSTSPNEYFYYDGHRVIEHHTDASGTMQLNKQYVYGLNYIDEPVAYYDNDGTGNPTTTPHFILRAANYDVVAITDDQGTLIQQMTLDPYGNYLYIEDENGAPYPGGDADVSELLIPLGRNGLWYDPETGLYYVRARYYDPGLGRWRQRDPNGTALMLIETLAMNARTHSVLAGFAAQAQYRDGMNLQEFVGGNPLARLDSFGAQWRGDSGPIDNSPSMLIGEHTDPTNLPGDGSVEVCCRYTELGYAKDAILRVLKKRHCWLRTSGQAAGMGPAGGGPIEDGRAPSCGGEGAKVEITEHAGETLKGSANCYEVPGCDAKCVEKALSVGTPLGDWALDNNCQTFVRDVLRNCKCFNKCVKKTRRFDMDPSSSLSGSRLCTQWQVPQDYPVPRW